MSMVNKYWFKPKMYGWGVMPVTIEGFGITAIYVYTILSFVPKIDENINGFYTKLLLFTFIFLLIAFNKTKEKIRWRWGKW